MKRILIILFLIFSFSSLVACGCGNDDNNDEQPNGETPAVERFTVAFNVDGGTSINSINVEDSGLVSRPSDPTKEGHVFSGWYKDSLFVSLWDFNVDRITKNTTLYAKFDTILGDNITGVVFGNEVFTYDGYSKNLSIAGTLPIGVSVTYSNNNHMNAGVYTVTATLSGVGYETLVLTATLTIEKASIEGIVFSNATYSYDSFEKTVIITGNLPSSVSVTYNNNKGTDAGVYDATANINGGMNYHNLTLNATLTITAKEELLFSYIFNNAAYFQNNLDRNRLYKYDFINETLTKINNDRATHFTIHDNQLHYVSDSLFMPTLSRLDIVDLKTSIINQDAEYLISDDDYIYYAVNKLFGTSGIYRLSTTNDEFVEELLYEGKASYLVQDQNYIYFANGSSSGELHKISKTILNQASVLIHDETVSELLIKDDRLFFKQHTLLNNTIASIKTDGTDFNTVSQNNPKYMVIVGDFIYYSNIDLITSTLFGRGVYRVNLNGGISTKVLEEDNIRISSLNASGTYLYYYKVDDSRFYAYNLLTNTETDLTADYVLPEEPVVTGTIGTISVDGSNVFYQNLYDGNKLYRYNTLTGENHRLTSSAIDYMVIEGDYLYYRTVSLIFFKDLYRINIRYGGEAELINKDDSAHLVFVGDFIYYVNYKGTNTINRMKLDGSEDEIIQSVNASNLRYYNSKIYYIAGGVIYRMDLDGENVQSLISTSSTSHFEISNGVIYYRHTRNAPFNNQLRYVNIDGTNETTVDGVDPRHINIVGNRVYFYRGTLGHRGIYYYEIGTTNTIVRVNEDVYLAGGLTIYNGQMYFYNSAPIDVSPTGGDGHVYTMTIDGAEYERISE